MPNKVKNVQTDALGSTIGTLHVGRQDLSRLQTRKMKGLKRGVRVDGELVPDAEQVVSDESGDDDDDMDSADGEDGDLQMMANDSAVFMQSGDED